MEITSVILLVVLAVVLIYFILAYNQLVRLNQNVSSAWDNIDVLLAQRDNELPKLVDACRRHMQFERDTLMRVMQARANVSTARRQQNIGAVGQAEGELRFALARLFTAAEAFSDLKADRDFVYLHGRISSLERSIADQRELYNDSVSLNNLRIERFPDSIVAALFSFKPIQPLRFSARATTDIDVRELSQA